MIKEKSIFKVFLFGLILVFLVACESAFAEKIDVVGTGDGVKVLNAIGTAFSQNHPDIKISVPPSIGSGGGIKAVGKDQKKIGRIARPIKDKEKHFGLSYVPFAKIPVVFFVNKQVEVDNLTSEQICAIYKGQINNWKDLSNKNFKIRVVRREKGDSSLSILEKTFPGFKEVTISKKAKTVFKTDEMFSVVESKEGTIGFGPYDIAMDSDVKILSIDGNKPTDHGYPSVNTLALVFKEANKVGSLQQFIDFATSPAAHSVIQGAAAIPL